ncbi:hypothetical protein [Bosea sp. BIWAKO-01]|uniref:hypothetical protein n=1 Tax=Bosea sp. BIWAKO-01 TaxID=506668 RepID=UPI000853C38C|nr:hypothetical protein [Bosea sp. BIWAKO-01]
MRIDHARGIQPGIAWRDCLDRSASMSAGSRCHSGTRPPIFATCSGARQDPCCRQEIVDIGLCCGKRGHEAYDAGLPTVVVELEALGQQPLAERAEAELGIGVAEPVEATALQASVCRRALTQPALA